MEDFDRRHRDFHDAEERRKKEQDERDAALVKRARDETLAELAKQPPGEGGDDDHEWEAN